MSSEAAEGSVNISEAFKSQVKQSIADYQELVRGIEECDDPLELSKKTALAVAQALEKLDDAFILIGMNQRLILDMKE